MTDSAVMVFTFKSVERIVEEGGSASWRLDRNRARQCRYLVCARNAHDDRGSGHQEPHHSAFMVGRIREVAPAQDRPDGRYIILIDEYATVEVADAWQSGNRNPVRYIDLSELNIDPGTLDWKPVPAREVVVAKPVPETVPAEDDDDIRPLSMAEAKRRLALKYDVTPEDIDITIRG